MVLEYCRGRVRKGCPAGRRERLHVEAEDDRQVKYTNETCVLDRVNAAVEKYGAKCFSACPGARNTSSPCYGDCYTRTVAGDWYEHVDPMPVPLLVAAWETAFTSDDPATGGCEREELPYACGNEGPPPPSPSASAGTNSSPSS